jgi:hypothetical protein
MIKFFRHIRQQMIKENRTSKYLLYAIGEIVLVVIGILIALWINSSYESVKNQRSEKALLIDLKSEYIENQATLTATMETTQKQLDNVKRLGLFISPTPENVSDAQLDTLMLSLGSIPDYVLSQDIANSITNSGKMGLIRNKEITYMIAANSRFYNEYLRWWVANEKLVYDDVIPYISDKYPLKRVFNLFFKGDENASAFEIKRQELLSDMRFESMVGARMLDLQTVLNAGHRLFGQQQEVIEIIDTELKEASSE